jgi:hypothetical protein
MSRRPGERNWGDTEEQYPLALPALPQPYERRRLRLQVEIVNTSPPSYIVRHTNGNQWLVIMASDGTLEIAEAESDTKIDVTYRVLKAVKLFQQGVP